MAPRRHREARHLAVLGASGSNPSPRSPGILRRSRGSRRDAAELLNFSPRADPQRGQQGCSCTGRQRIFPTITAGPGWPSACRDRVHGSHGTSLNTARRADADRQHDPRAVGQRADTHRSAQQSLLARPGRRAGQARSGRNPSGTAHPSHGRTQNYVERIGRRLVTAIPGRLRQPQFRYTFQVVDRKDINAFALPGGPIFVNRGMLDAARSDGEVAGVIAHELSHIVLRHGTAQATKDRSSNSARSQVRSSDR